MVKRKEVPVRYWPKELGGERRRRQASKSGRTWTDAELKEFFTRKDDDAKVGLEETTRRAQASKEPTPERGDIVPPEIGDR